MLNGPKDLKEVSRIVHLDMLFYPAAIPGANYTHFSRFLHGFTDIFVL
jgi:hypothetical protein